MSPAPHISGIESHIYLLRNCLIVEGGAKAAILPDVNANFTQCFENFVDSIIDLLIPGQSPGIKEQIVDLSGRSDPEVLFFGPDEVSLTFALIGSGVDEWRAEHGQPDGLGLFPRQEARRSLVEGEPAMLLIM